MAMRTARSRQVAALATVSDAPWTRLRRLGRTHLVIDARAPAIRLDGRAGIAARDRRWLQQLLPEVRASQPQLVTCHGQRRHARLVNQQAAPVCPAVREYLQVDRKSTRLNSS